MKNRRCDDRWWAVALLNLALLISADATAARSYWNKPPIIAGTPATTAMVGQPYSFTPRASDPENRTLLFSIFGLPQWATFDRSTGTLAGTPGMGDVGITGRIVIAVSDRRSLAYLQEFSISVTAAPGAAPANVAPTISGVPATSATIGSLYSFQPTATDGNGDALGFSIANRPDWASFNTSTGRLSGTPTAAATHGGIVISVSDGKSSTAMSPFSIVVAGTGVTNRAPALSGIPAPSVNVGGAYAFTPAASDPDGDALTFSIANKPVWANFNAVNGQITGTPTAANVGTFSGIVVTVSDGKASTSLPGFTISVTELATGAATLSWTAPTSNTDGTPLTNLAGYRIYYGTAAGALTRTIDIANASVSTYLIGNLPPATWYFAVKARSTNGVESDFSNISSKVIN